MLINLDLSNRHKCWAKVITTVDTSKQNGYAFTGDFVKSDKLIELQDGAYVLTYEERGSRNNRKAFVDLYKVKDEVLEPLLNGEGADWALQIRDKAAHIINAVLPSGLEGFSDVDLMRELSKRGYSTTKDSDQSGDAEEPLINSTKFAEMLGISKQAFHDRYKRSLNPNSKNGLPKTSHSQDGKNPMWYLSVAQPYVDSKKVRS